MNEIKKLECELQKIIRKLIDDISKTENGFERLRSMYYLNDEISDLTEKLNELQ